MEKLKLYYDMKSEAPGQTLALVHLLKEAVGPQDPQQLQHHHRLQQPLRHCHLPETQSD